MSPADLVLALQAVKEEREVDKEMWHLDADLLLIRTLRALGYNEAMNLYSAWTDKWWYA